MTWLMPLNKPRVARYGIEGNAGVSQNRRGLHGRRQNSPAALPGFIGTFCFGTRTYFFQAMAVRGTPERDSEARRLFCPRRRGGKPDHFARSGWGIARILQCLPPPRDTDLREKGWAVP